MQKVTLHISIGTLAAFSSSNNEIKH